MELLLWSSVTPLCSVSLHPSRIIDNRTTHVLQELPQGCIQIHHWVLLGCCSKQCVIKANIHKLIQSVTKMSSLQSNLHRHIKPRKLTFNYWNKFSSIIQHCRHSLINNIAILRYIGFINKWILLYVMTFTFSTQLFIQESCTVNFLVWKHANSNVHLLEVKALSTIILISTDCWNNSNSKMVVIFEVVYIFTKKCMSKKRTDITKCINMTTIFMSI